MLSCAIRIEILNGLTDAELTIYSILLFMLTFDSGAKHTIVDLSEDDLYIGNRSAGVDVQWPLKVRRSRRSMTYIYIYNCTGI